MLYSCFSRPLSLVHGIIRAFVIRAFIHTLYSTSRMYEFVIVGCRCLLCPSIERVNRCVLTDSFSGPCRRLPLVSSGKVEEGAESTADRGWPIC